MTDCKQIRGAELLRNPQLNRADAFTEEERDRHGLRGLLPPVVSTRDAQIARMRAMIARCPTPLEKFMVLDSLHATDESL
ncbi:MAG: NAD-dependent malic enzyme, partial [Sutterella sp.]